MYSQLEEIVRRLTALEDAVRALHVERPQPRVYALYTCNYGQTFATGVDTEVNYNQKYVDTHNAYNGTDFVVPYTGTYLLTASLLFNAGVAMASTNSSITLRVIRNGVMTAALDRLTGLPSSTTIYYPVNGAAVINFIAGDVVSFSIHQNSGGTQTVYSAETYYNLGSFYLLP